MSKQKNVLGEDLESCSTDPMTGWFRDGCCNTSKDDSGLHTVCVKVSDEFLKWCKEAGNDLIHLTQSLVFLDLKMVISGVSVPAFTQERLKLEKVVQYI